jgi:RimJ/RimL family protein N-acetyltransferase
LRYGFEQCGMDSVIGATDTPNQRAVQIMQRIGMVFRERREYKGLDTVFYGLTREEFGW